VEDVAGLRMETMVTSHCQLIVDANGEQLIADANEGERGSCSGDYKGYAVEAGANERFFRNWIGDTKK